LSPAVDDAGGKLRASIRESYAGPVEFARDGSRYAP
jgi:hypothetical protein